MRGSLLTHGGKKAKKIFSGKKRKKPKRWVEGRYFPYMEEKEKQNPEICKKSSVKIPFFLNSPSGNTRYCGKKIREKGTVLSQKKENGEGRKGKKKI